jgi:hypothetical protein
MHFDGGSLIEAGVDVNEPWYKLQHELQLVFAD